MLLQRKFHKYSMCSLRNKQHDIKFIADSLFWGNSQGSGGRVLGETRRIRSDYSVAAAGTRISLHVSQVLICQLSLEVFLLTKKKKKKAVGEIIYFSGIGLHPCLAWRTGSPLSGMAEEEGPGVIMEEREMGGYPGLSSIHL